MVAAGPGDLLTARQAIEVMAACKPEVVVMDVALPDLSGVEATRQVLAHTPGVKVVALSVHADQQYVAGMLQAGASAYVLREEAAVELGDRAGQCAFGLPRRDSRSNRQQPPAGLGEVNPHQGRLP